MSSNGESSSSIADNSAEDVHQEQKRGKYAGQKREHHISWEEYFMAVAFLAAQRSKDPNTQVGCCIVNDENKIVGVGYNGMPRGCEDDDFPWTKNNDFHEDKLTYVCHAEMNACLNAYPRDTKGCKLYVTLFPCNECAKIIIQAGIKEIIYGLDRKKKKELASKRMFEAAKIECKSFQSGKTTIHIELKGSGSFCTCSPPIKKQRRDEIKKEG